MYGPRGIGHPRPGSRRGWIESRGGCGCGTGHRSPTDPPMPGCGITADGMSFHPAPGPLRHPRRRDLPVGGGSRPRAAGPWPPTCRLQVCGMDHVGVKRAARNGCGGATESVVVQCLGCTPGCTVLLTVLQMITPVLLGCTDQVRSARYLGRPRHRQTRASARRTRSRRRPATVSEARSARRGRDGHA
jgi:hypothetical protein